MLCCRQSLTLHQMHVQQHAFMLQLQDLLNSGRFSGCCRSSSRTACRDTTFLFLKEACRKRRVPGAAARHLAHTQQACAPIHIPGQVCCLLPAAFDGIHQL